MCCVLSHSAGPSSVSSCGLYPARLLCPWGFSRHEYWSGLPRPPPGDLPNPGIKPRSPTLRADSLPSEPPGKPKNNWSGELPLLQGNFLTQEPNQALLHCRGILSQLSYQGSVRVLQNLLRFGRWVWSSPVLLFLQTSLILSSSAS